MAKVLKVCANRHRFYKSSNCPTCPICEQECKPQEGFLSKLSAPARRALENEGITTPEQLSLYSEVEILQLHGIGPSSLPKLREALEAKQLSFRK